MKQRYLELRLIECDDDELGDAVFHQISQRISMNVLNDCKDDKQFILYRQLLRLEHQLNEYIKTATL